MSPEWIYKYEKNNYDLKNIFIIKQEFNQKIE